MKEKTDVPEGVLQFKRVETVIMNGGTFRNGSFEKIEVLAKTVGGWRGATLAEREWFLANDKSFRDQKRAERTPK